MNYNITIKDLKRLSTSGSLSDVVEQIDYNICVTASRDGGTSLVNRTSKISLDSVSSSNFIEFDNLDENTVKAWVTGSTEWSEELSKAETHTSKSVWPENFIEKNVGGLPW